MKNFSRPLALIIAIWSATSGVSARVAGAARPDVHSSPSPNAGLDARINLNRTALFFGAKADGSASTGSQSFTINNIGAEMAWSVTPDQPWVAVSPATGVGSATVTVSVAGDMASSATAVLTVSADGATNSPRTLPVTFTMHASPPAPTGLVETPAQNARDVTGALPVTGWVVHAIQVANVKIWRDAIPGEPAGAWIFVGDAMFIDGARPDVEASMATPLNYAAGWGYMLLTNVLPNQGNGTFTLHAMATAVDGSMTLLGSRTIACDNAHAMTPFGSIDTPAQGGTASGASYFNWGWALTPNPAWIAVDGSTLRVYIDGVPRGQPVYNRFRDDIAQFFPGLANSRGAVAYFALDTTTMTNGVHTIAWTVTDNLGRAAGIGSRYFTVVNGPRGSVTASGAPGPLAPAAPDLGERDTALSTAAVDFRIATVYHGAGEHVRTVAPDTDGVRQISTRELERLEVELDYTEDAASFAGYLLVNGELRALPAGAALDGRRGRFYWQPGAGFVGSYDFVFVRSAGAERSQIRVRVAIEPHQTAGSR